MAKGSAWATAILALQLVACGDGFGNSSNSSGDRETPDKSTRQAAFKDSSRVFAEPGDNTVACRLQSASTIRAGKHYQVTLPSASGETISFEVIEPKTINCTEGNPLVLQGHGFGGARIQDPTGTNLERLQDNGYAVISIDQRGFNDSTGTVRVMDPDFEGQDLLAILDWAESNLDYLSYQQKAGELNLVAGSTGGSYGGMYQLLIHNIDPKNRLDALTPDITPHDLRYSLYPGRTIKSSWVLLLVAGGEAGANQPLVGGLDPVIKETLINGAATNEIKTPAQNFFYYHSVRYFADPDGTDITNQDFLAAMMAAAPLYVPAPSPKPVDILFTIGMRDTLFNFNEGLANFTAYKKLGGDVRFFSHESGHILPGSQTLLGQLDAAGAGINELIAQVQANGGSTPELQKPSGRANCGSLNLWDAQVAFLNEKLLPPNRETTAASVQTDMDRLKTAVCMSLDDADGTAAGGTTWVAADALRPNPLSTLPLTTTTVPVPNSLAGAVTLLQPTFIPITNGPLTLAGVAQLKATVASPIGVDGCAVPPLDTSMAPAELSPILAALPSALPTYGCDSIIYVGLGKRSGSAAPELIDEQITPLRGLGEFDLSLVGTAERLVEGEELGLMVYGYNLQYPVTPSRDLLLPAVNISGSIALPLQP